MIFDQWENLSNLNFSAQWNEIISQVQKLRKDNLSEGRYELCHNAYLNVMTFYGKDENIYEAHKKFVDIHFVLEGSERIDIAFVSDIEKNKAYNPEDFYQEDKDIIFYTKKSEPHAIIYLDNTNFLLATPNDAHAPCLSGKLDQGNTAESKDKNLKAVLKIPVEYLN